MLEIKTLADQLRDQLRADLKDEGTSTDDKINKKESTAVKKNAVGAVEPQKADAFFKAIEEFKLETSEKSMIRVDSRTINLLKRMKLAKGIDMNRFIVFALHQYINQHPWLPKHIQEIIKNSDI